MPVAKSAAFDILPRHTDGRSVGDDRAECQSLGRCPVHGGCIGIGEDVLASFEQLGQLAVQLKAVG